MFKLNKIASVLLLSLTFSVPHICIAEQVSATKVQLAPLKSQDDAARNKLIGFMNKISGFTASFTQEVYSEASNALQKSTGTIAVSKPNLVNWHTLSPDETQIISDGETLWFFDPFIEQVTAYSFDTSINNTPILLLSSNDESLWQQYNIIEVNVNEFEIHSLDQNSQVKSLFLHINQETDSESIRIEKFVINDASGQRSEISLNNFEHTKSINNGTFIFTLPDGVYLDDQR